MDTQTIQSTQTAQQNKNMLGLPYEDFLVAVDNKLNELENQRPPEKLTVKRVDWEDPNKKPAIKAQLVALRSQKEKFAQKYENELKRIKLYAELKKNQLSDEQKQELLDYRINYGERMAQLKEKQLGQQAAAAQQKATATAQKQASSAFNTEQRTQYAYNKEFVVQRDAARYDTLKEVEVGMDSYNHKKSEISDKRTKALSNIIAGIEKTTGGKDWALANRYKAISYYQDAKQTVPKWLQDGVIPEEISAKPQAQNVVPKENKQLPQPKNKAEYDKLPSGTRYLAPDGTIKKKK